MDKLVPSKTLTFTALQLWTDYRDESDVGSLPPRLDDYAEISRRAGSNILDHSCLIELDIEDDLHLSYVGRILRRGGDGIDAALNDLLAYGVLSNWLRKSVRDRKPVDGALVAGDRMIPFVALPFSHADGRAVAFVGLVIDVDTIGTLIDMLASPGASIQRVLN